MSKPTKEDVTYVSGPMSGIPNLNFPLFNRVTAALRERGYTVLNPVETEGNTPCSWLSCIAKDLISFDEYKVTAICLLPGWWKSYGAWIEIIAGLKGKYRICFVSTLLPVSEYKTELLQGCEPGSLRSLVTRLSIFVHGLFLPFRRHA